MEGSAPAPPEFQGPPPGPPDAPPSAPELAGVVVTAMGSGLLPAAAVKLVAREGSIRDPRLKDLSVPRRSSSGRRLPERDAEERGG